MSGKTLVPRRKYGAPLRDTFWDCVRVGKRDECWPWLKSTHPRTRYGQIQVCRRPAKAHRIAWELHNGSIPRGKYVCHHCDNPPCCNPDHLFLGTQDDNMKDMASKGRGRIGVSGIRGVRHSKNGKRWTACKRVDGTLLHLGTFDTAEEAEEAFRNVR